MAEHEPCIGASDDWYTPPEIFDRLELIFDLDPCSPGPGHWVPARHIFTKADDGLSRPWRGLVFMNPPFGGRNGHVPWLRRFLDHANGVAIVRAYTSSAWFHEWVVLAETLCFPRGKTKFIRPDGSIGKSPGHGVVLLGMGAEANAALARSGLGLTVSLHAPACNAEARKKVLAKHCDCEKAAHDYPGITCDYHKGDERLYAAQRRLARLYLRAAPPVPPISTRRNRP